MAVATGRRRGRRIAFGVGGLVAVLLVLSQALLPRIAADRVRSKLERYGTVDSVSVSAWPAIELLWGKADKVTIHANSLTLSPAQVASLIVQARAFDDMNVSVAHVTLHVPGLPVGVEVANARVAKRGSTVTASSTVTQAQLDQALPGGVGVTPLHSGPEGVTVRASGALFGISASLDVLVRPLEGNVLAEPEGLPFASLASVTLFSDPHLKVREVAFGPVGGRPSTYSISVGGNIG